MHVFVVIILIIFSKILILGKFPMDASYNGLAQMNEGRLYRIL